MSRSARRSRMRIPFGDDDALTFAEVGRRIGLSASRVETLWYQRKPLARTQPDRAKRVLFEGEMRTAEEIAPMVGLAVRTVRERMTKGRPLGKIRRGPTGTEVEFNGEMLTRAEIARRLGRTSGYVNYRLERGLPLDAEVRKGRPLGSVSGSGAFDEITKSGVYRVSRAEGENGLYWDEDEEAREHHRKCCNGSYGECTLDEVAQLWKISRERVRQIQDVAIGKIRRLAKCGNKDALDALAWFEWRSEMRARQKLDHWEQAEANAPGWFAI